MSMQNKIVYLSYTLQIHLIMSNVSLSKMNLLFKCIIQISRISWCHWIFEFEVPAWVPKLGANTYIVFWSPMSNINKFLYSPWHKTSICIKRIFQTHNICRMVFELDETCIYYVKNIKDWVAHGLLGIFNTHSVFTMRHLPCWSGQRYCETHCRSPWCNLFCNSRGANHGLERGLWRSRPVKGGDPAARHRWTR